MNDVMKMFKELDLPQSNQSFDMACSLDTAVPLSAVKPFLEKVEKIEGCAADLIQETD